VRFYPFFLLAALLPGLTGCVNPAEAKGCGEVIEVNSSFVYDEDGIATYVDNGCYSRTETNGVLTYDGTDCCPPDYEFVGMGPNGGVMCEKVCDPGQAAGQTAFVVHTLTYAFTDAIEILYPIPPDPNP
jgi:hypothetical protein